MKKRSPFLLLSAILLWVTGAAKIVSAFGPSQIFLLKDPVFLIPFKHLFLAIGSLELLAAGFLFFSSNVLIANCLIAWLATGFIIYRIAIAWLGFEKPCPCLGSFTELLHLSPQLVDWVLGFVAMFLFLGSWIALARLWRVRSGVSNARSIH